MMKSVALVILALWAAGLGSALGQHPQQTDERPVSKFQVATDEWLALPEVFSKLDFAADDSFARADDLEGQSRLRASRFWGRLYVDGWPQSIQFFRAHFGTEPPLGKKVLVFAEPRDACSALLNSDLSERHVVLVKRGSCTFGTKAVNVRRTPASAMVVINNEPGLDHLPGPDAHDIDLAVVSIAQPEGHLLEAVFDAGPSEPGLSPGRLLEGYLVPINCEHSGATCLPATFAERDLVRGLAEGGTLRLLHNGSSLPPSELPLEYLLAQFGVKVPHANSSFALAMARPSDACTTLSNANELRGKVGVSLFVWLSSIQVVLVRRGGCAFVTKAEEVQSAGGVAAIVGSVHDFIVRMVGVRSLGAE